MSRSREIVLKSEADIAKMAAAGSVVARVLSELSAAVRPGVTTLELDQMAESISAEAGAQPSFKGYQGFPASICASVNEQVIHGIPNRIPLKEGDVVGLDYGAFLNGVHADSAMTVPVGEVDDATLNLLKVTEEALWKAIGLVRPGAALGDIGSVVQRHCERNGFSVVREMVGHGIGAELHEAPEVPNYGRAGAGVKLRRGMTFCIEPMINAGRREVDTLPDGWTIVTRDGSRSAHFEHTVAVTADGVMVLTDRGGSVG